MSTPKIPEEDRDGNRPSHVVGQLRLKPGDPEAGAKLAALLNRCLTREYKARPGAPGFARETMRFWAPQLVEALGVWCGAAFSMLGAALLAYGAKPGSVRVAQAEISDATGTFDWDVYVDTDDGASTRLAGVRCSVPETREIGLTATATAGTSFGVWVHLTPEGSRALWDFGDVIQAEAKETADGGSKDPASEDWDGDTDRYERKP